MKISKIKTVAALTAMTVLLSGCDAPYELTETEEGIITNYAAHVVTKFNTDQDQQPDNIRYHDPLQNIQF